MKIKTEKLKLVFNWIYDNSAKLSEMETFNGFFLVRKRNVSFDDNKKFPSATIARAISSNPERDYRTGTMGVLFAKEVILIIKKTIFILKNHANPSTRSNIGT